MEENKEGVIMRNQPKIVPEACVDEVDKYLDKWNTLENYVLQKKL